MELLAASELEKKTDFEDKKELEKLDQGNREGQARRSTEKLSFDEEHSLYELVITGGAKTSGDTKVSWALASTPEYKRLRALAQLIGGVDRPPFTVTRNGDKIMKENAAEVLAYVLEDAKKNFTITRFKGLGEMNPEQLWATTMNAETRTLLQVKLEDVVAAEEIFTTLMGENVGTAASSSRKMRSKS